MSAPRVGYQDSHQRYQALSTLDRRSLSNWRLAGPQVAFPSASERRRIKRTATCCVGMLALIARTVSYLHMHRASESDGNVLESSRIRASSQLNHA